MKKSALILAVLAAAACKGQNLAEVPSDSLRIRTIILDTQERSELRGNVAFVSSMFLGFGAFLATRPEQEAKNMGIATMAIGGGVLVAFQFHLSSREKELVRALEHRYTE